MLPKLASWALALSCLSSVNSYINYTTMTRYFLQDDPKTNASMFDFTATNFGRTYPSDSNCASSADKTQWQRFADQVAALNAAAAPNTEYNVFHVGRHGEGYHNAAESYYGTPAGTASGLKKTAMRQSAGRMPASRPKACNRRCQ